MDHPLVERMTTNEKLELIRLGIKRRSLTGVKHLAKKTIENKVGKFSVVEKQKKYEESAVVKKKNNYIQFVSKTGIETVKDLTKISGPKMETKLQTRNEEIIVQKKKKIEYLDNYQYKETKQFGKNPKPALVIHNRLGNIIGGTVEEYTFQRHSANQRPTNLLLNKSTGNAFHLKTKFKLPGETSTTATKSMTTTTKVGRRVRRWGPTSTTTKTTTTETTTRTTKRGTK